MMSFTMDWHQLQNVRDEGNFKSNSTINNGYALEKQIERWNAAAKSEVNLQSDEDFARILLDR